MSRNKKITIHHFEDEPETLHWLPGCLLNIIWVRHPEWIQNGGHYHESEDEQIISFKIVAPDFNAIIVYRAYRSKAEIKDYFEPEPNDIVIIDLVLGNESGAELYKPACDAVGEDRVFVLTGYPARMPEKLRHQLDVTGHLFTKPPDPVGITDVLIKLTDLE